METMRAFVIEEPGGPEKFELPGRNPPTRTSQRVGLDSKTGHSGSTDRSGSHDGGSRPTYTSPGCSASNVSVKWSQLLAQTCPRV